MIVLDTDHLSELQRKSSKGLQLLRRLDETPDELATTIITVEEQMRGWLKEINRKDLARDALKQVPFYERLGTLFDFFAKWIVLPFNRQAAETFDRLRKQKIRLKTMDLKIAAIVIRAGARLLSANLRDFRQVPALVVEDWLRG